MIKIEVDGKFADITNLIWHSSDKELSVIVSIFAEYLIIGYTPWPDYTLAEMACKALGGKIIEAIDPPEYIEERVY